MTSIQKLTLVNPDVNIMIINNARIEKNIIYVNNENINLFLPTMYKSWTTPQSSHIRFIKDNHNIINDVDNNDILYIFDTWGISSYYHLLIDHIIPMWITKNIIEEKLNLDSKNKHFFLRISNNKYNKQLENTNEIFKYILNDNYIENISNKRFKYIIYGYAYTYRPYHGPNYPINYFNNYKVMLDKFINKVESKVENKMILDNKYIIIPKRKTRNNDIIDYLYEQINKLYNIKYIDFSDYSINEQVNICQSSCMMIGMEGAAFANQVFMPKRSSLVCIVNKKEDVERFMFHSTLSKYLDNEFNSIVINSRSNQCILDKIINIIQIKFNLII